MSSLREKSVGRKLQVVLLKYPNDTSQQSLGEDIAVAPPFPAQTAT